MSACLPACRCTLGLSGVSNYVSEGIASRARVGGDTGLGPCLADAIINAAPSRPTVNNALRSSIEKVGWANVRKRIWM